jgi:hypothetical protein
MFHQRCLALRIEPSPLPGDWGYSFRCRTCARSTVEHFSLLRKSWVDIALVTFYNLKLQAAQRGEPERRFFRFKEEICTFIDRHWRALCHGRTRTVTWNNTVGSALSTHSDLFQNGLPFVGQSGWWGALDYISPFLLRLHQLRQQQSSEMRVTTGREGRSGKRHVRTGSNAITELKRRRGRPPKHSTSLSSAFFSSTSSGRFHHDPPTVDYSLSSHSVDGEDDDDVSIESDNDEDDSFYESDEMLSVIDDINEQSGGGGGQDVASNSGPAKKKSKLLPEPAVPAKVYYRPLAKYTTMCIAAENSAPQILLSPDRLVVRNEKGYRMARAAYGVPPVALLEGYVPTPCGWYWEARLLPPDQSGITLMDNTKRPLPSAAWRLGWATEKADVQAPVGFDHYSYGLRCHDGHILHLSRSSSYGQSLGPGDVLGFLLLLPNASSASSTAATTVNSSDCGVTAESKSSSSSSLPSKSIDSEGLVECPGSEIHFFKNGVSMGVAFRNVYVGTYYPAVSLYYGASVAVNFGPNFAFPPTSPLGGCSIRPCSELPALYRSVPPLTTLMAPTSSGQVSAPTTESQLAPTTTSTHQSVANATLEQTPNTRDNNRGTDNSKVRSDDGDKERRDERAVQHTADATLTPTSTTPFQTLK